MNLNTHNTVSGWRAWPVRSPVCGLTSEVSAVQVSPQRRVVGDGAEVSTDGGQHRHRAHVEQPEDPQEQFWRKSGQAESHGERHG